ncbi:MAG: SPOR domain-containing protein [Porticoccaceae bacterium]|nr:SPOR domain-containing protein [Porticoccaceae bacterium]
MSDGLKQRIIGALVLGALGLILLPLALDFTDPKKVDRSSLIPPAPNVVVTEIVVAKRPDEVKDAADVVLVFDVSKLQPVQENDTSYQGLDQSGLPQRWYLQVGSYEEQASANKLKQALLTKQYKVFLKSVKINKKVFHRVYIGPKISRRSAIADKNDIDKLLTTDSIVLKYVP